MADNRKEDLRLKIHPKSTSHSVVAQDSRKSKNTKTQKLTRFRGVRSNNKKTKENPHVDSHMTPLVSKEEGKLIFTVPSHNSLLLRITKAPHFPKIYRFITEARVLLGILSVVFLVGIIICLIAIQDKVVQRNLLEQKRAAIQKQILRWQAIAKQNPGYRDAYFQLALLEYQLGDFQATQEDLNTVEGIDPTFEEAYQLEKMMQK